MSDHEGWRAALPTTVQVRSKITANSCGEGGSLAGEETVCVGGRRQDRVKDSLLVGPSVRGPCDWRRLQSQTRKARGWGRRWRSAACISACLVRRASNIAAHPTRNFFLHHQTGNWPCSAPSALWRCGPASLRNHAAKARPSELSLALASVDSLARTRCNDGSLLAGAASAPWWSFKSPCGRDMGNSQRYLA